MMVARNCCTSRLSRIWDIRLFEHASLMDHPPLREETAAVTTAKERRRWGRVMRRHGFVLLLPRYCCWCCGSISKRWKAFFTAPFWATQIEKDERSTTLFSSKSLFIIVLSSLSYMFTTYLSPIRYIATNHRPVIGRLVVAILRERVLVVDQKPKWTRQSMSR